ncbi:MAG: NAD(P)-dependent oxidoreductase [Anaerolineales bacterium]|jgi:nucleoside-diphosphate-sugar epimerase
MRILITGAYGFIGKAARALLVQRGHVILPAIHPDDQDVSITSSFPEVIVADLTREGALDVAPGLSPQVVVHLAAEKPASFEGEEAKRTADANARMDRNVIRFCQETGTGLVFASGTSVYGLKHNRPMVESDPIDPVGPYVRQKAETEELGLQTLSENGVSFTSLRICAPYGPGQKARTVLNVFIERALQDRPLLYHGSGKRQQDFTYVGDIAEAISLAVERGKSGIFNIAAGRPVTMRRLAELVVDCVDGCKSVVQPSGADDPQEGETALFSIEKAKVELGWEPRTSLKEGVRICVTYRLAEGR